MCSIVSSWAKTFTPLEWGEGKGVKCGSGLPSAPLGTLLSRDIRSQVCGPNAFSTVSHRGFAREQSAAEMTLEGKSARLFLYLHRLL